MTAYEWKPGDVAFCTLHGHAVLKAPDYGEWHHPGYPVPQRLSDSTLRPLVVIDPEDRAQVERLWVAMMNSNRLDMLDALREFANPTPPEPEEPTRVGAVVENAAGDLYVRAPGRGPLVWVDEFSKERVWADIDAVTVLSEGVQP